MKAGGDTRSLRFAPVEMTELFREFVGRHTSRLRESRRVREKLTSALKRRHIFEDFIGPTEVGPFPKPA